MTTLPAKRRGKVRKLVANKEGNGQNYGQRGDGRILARHERFRTLADGVRDQPHFRRSGVVRQHRPGKKQSKNQAEHTGDKSDPQESAAIGARQQRSSPVLGQWPIVKRKPFKRLQRVLATGVDRGTAAAVPPAASANTCKPAD